MLIHDSFSSVGVTLAILRELVWSDQWRYVGRARSITEYRRDLPAGTCCPPRQRRTPSGAAAVVREEPGDQGAAQPQARWGAARITGREPEWPY
jgi:hypothetical protein